MDLPENSNATDDKSWDHPWTTNEMRQHRDDWSLSADAGLLKHLQQFSDNLTDGFEKIQEKFNSLSCELEVTSAIIDNVTNTSLALANTQFIESRVREDDSEMDESIGIKDPKVAKEVPYQDDLIACVSQSIKESLNIMDEKFQRFEVIASDSEDEGDIPVPSVVLKPKDPYQNRPLPYVIGSDKWKASKKCGLDTSSSDSEPPDGDEDSASESSDEIQRNTGILNNQRDSLSRRSVSPSSSGFSSRNERTNPVKDYSGVSLANDKLETHSQDTLNSGSDITTPNVAQTRAENSSKETPSFAEELAKRLGNVLPAKRPPEHNQEADRSSINRYKDDLFASNGNDVFDTKSENLFCDDDNLFDEDVSNSLWKNKPYRPPIANIIPPSLDVPPPMHAETAKPKSAFDDLCADPESDDSDDIFAPKSTMKRLPANSRSTNEDKRESNEHSREKRFSNVLLGENASNMATSTPETKDNGGLFGDENDYEDDNALFGASIINSRVTERSPEVARSSSGPMPPGLSITQADILSSNLGSRLFQRVPRQGSSDSSDNESSVNNSNRPDGGRIITESDSSGISIRPNNNSANNATNNTFGLGVDFQPQSESTRLKSEEIYRERFPSDSLFDGRTRQPESINSIDNSSLRPHEARIVVENLDSARDEDSDIDDVFGPPPLPKHNDSKSKSNDDLFSNSSSESRSHKSFDLLAASDSQYDVKITSDRSGGLFDEDVDIFGDGDAPQIDIFGEAFKTTSLLPPRESSNEKIPKILSDSRIKSIVNNDDSSPRRINENSMTSLTFGKSDKSSAVKAPSIFDDSEDDNEDDLFGKNFLVKDRKSMKIMLDTEEDVILANKPSVARTTALNETKKDYTSPLARENIASARTEKRDAAKRDSDGPSVEKPLPSYSSSRLFDNLEDQRAEDNALADDVSGEMKTPESADEISFQAPETREETKKQESELKINNEKESNPNDSAKEKLSETSSLKKDDEMEKLFKNERDVSMTDGGTISKGRNSSENNGEITRRDPPKTLSIRLPIASDDSSQIPRRAVSGKIKNLMGKMGDLRILSPTDTPPMWRKSEEKTDSDCEKTESKDSEDGGSMSLPSTKSSTISSSKIEDNDVLPETKVKPAPSSPADDSGNSETAVSFDLPAQVEVLAVTASKSRAKIQAKRRPQSRHARQSALRKSGIDFDVVDNSATDAAESDPSDNTFSGISDKISAVVKAPKDSQVTDKVHLDEKDTEIGKSSIDKTAETSASLMPEDRSEMSFSKGSSLSLNKNTLLSPSTDEEDLFDVPPDLPEDPPKEDTLFGRAPILSPIDRLLKNETRSKDRSRDKDSNSVESKETSRSRMIKKPTKMEKSLETMSKTEEPTDPLRDNSHDPLKDPSQLFAFVTKTPSPEKGQNVLFNEDASLFTRLAKKTAEEAKSSSKKTALDLFADDTGGGDLFSGNLAISTKKSMRPMKNSSLFDDMDNTEDDFTSDLFGGRSKNTREKAEKIDDSNTRESSENSGRASPSRSIFDDDDGNGDDPFVDSSNKKVIHEPEERTEKDDARLFSVTSKITKDATRMTNIFGDQSSGEEDLFASGKIIGSGKITGAGSSLFSVDHDDDDADDIFRTKTSAKSPKAEAVESRTSVKKAVTRDLKKTAETIVRDPLSMLQDD